MRERTDTEAQPGRAAAGAETMRTRHSTVNFASRVDPIEVFDDKLDLLRVSAWRDQTRFL